MIAAKLALEWGGGVAILNRGGGGGIKAILKRGGKKNRYLRS